MFISYYFTAMSDTQHNKLMEIQTQLENEYLKTFSDKELKAYHIAKSHLGTTFQMEKSIGFAEWKEKQTR